MTNKYNLFNKTKIPTNIIKDDLKLKEYGLWYKGDVNERIKFYKQEAFKDSQFYTPNFYRLAPCGPSIRHTDYSEKNGFTVYSYNIAPAVSKIMSDLIFSDTPKITINTGNKQLDKKVNKRFNEICDENKIIEEFKHISEEISAYGSGVLTVSIDRDLSDSPIIQFYNRSEVIINRVKTKIVSIILKDFYDYNDDKYVLLTELSYGSIEYKLFNINKSDDFLFEVPLSTIEETRELSNIYLINSNGERFNHIPAVFIENKNNEESDYSTAISCFMGLDEDFSNLQNYIRKMKPKKAITQNALKIDAESGQPIIPSDYDTEHVILWDSSPDTVQMMADQKDFNLDNSISGYINAMRLNKENIATQVGLSPASLGVDNSGSNSSGEALNIRENISTRTRDEKIVKWRYAIKELSRLLLSMDTAEFNGDIIKVFDLYDYDVSIEFSDYNKKTFADIINEAQQLSDLGIADTELLVKRVFEDTGIYNKEECDNLINRLKGEKNLNRENDIKQLQEEYDKIINENEEP